MELALVLFIKDLRREVEVVMDLIMEAHLEVVLDLTLRNPNLPDAVKCSLGPLMDHQRVATGLEPVLDLTFTANYAQEPVRFLVTAIPPVPAIKITDLFSLVVYKHPYSSHLSFF